MRLAGGFFYRSSIRFVCPILKLEFVFLFKRKIQSLFLPSIVRPSYWSPLDFHAGPIRIPSRKCVNSRVDIAWYFEKNVYFFRFWKTTRFTCKNDYTGYSSRIIKRTHNWVSIYLWLCLRKCLIRFSRRDTFLWYDKKIKKIIIPPKPWCSPIARGSFYYASADNFPYVIGHTSGGPTSENSRYRPVLIDVKKSREVMIRNRTNGNVLAIRH